ncbi:predicted protein [Streptomyces viridosporus ATCC 14672]|uniref:Predicted protein n=1 Tax=Streptomyces viridosporus (strain ATCC 14672 / DSM 40746 / JCM 4963 / KCTC 9882 / NRRL B-12104 / FH 1290) TaxID=566461 RepID=D5ZYB8_STRV1|nr:predicted protein [Streptomyces viridosporus ATCC 14672]
MSITVRDIHGSESPRESLQPKVHRSRTWSTTEPARPFFGTYDMTTAHRRGGPTAPGVPTADREAGPAPAQRCRPLSGTGAPMGTADPHGGQGDAGD